MKSSPIVNGTRPELGRKLEAAANAADDAGKAQAFPAEAEVEEKFVVPTPTQLQRLLGYVLLVKWVDSAASPGWREIDGAGPARIASCGILVRHDAESIVLAMGISSGGRCHEQMTIPLGCLQWLDTLSVGPVTVPKREEAEGG